MYCLEVIKSINKPRNPDKTFKRHADIHVSGEKKCKQKKN